MRTAKALADLSLQWAHRSFCRFCHEAAHIREGLNFHTYSLPFVLCCASFTFHYIEIGFLNFSHILND